MWDLNDGIWNENKMSSLLQPRRYHSVVTLEKIGVYVLGGLNEDGPQTISEFLPANSFQWTQGPSLPSADNYGCAISISATSFIYINNGVIREYEIDIENPTTSGGWLEENRWPVLSSRTGQGCARTEKYILIAGGLGDAPDAPLSSTMVLDIATRQVQLEENLATPRNFVQLATITTGGITRTFALGGALGAYANVPFISNVEEWDEDGNHWKPSADLKHPRGSLSASTVPLRLVCSLADP